MSSAATGEIKWPGMGSTAAGVSFRRSGHAATDLRNDVRQFALVFHRQSATLIKLLNAFGSQGPEQGEFLLVLAGLLFEQMETCPHDFTGVSKSSRPDLFVYKSVKVLG